MLGLCHRSNSLPRRVLTLQPRRGLHEASEPLSKMAFMRLAEHPGDVQETQDMENRGFPLLKAFKGAILAPKSPETGECRLVSISLCNVMFFGRSWNGAHPDE